MRFSQMETLIRHALGDGQNPNTDVVVMPGPFDPANHPNDFIIATGYGGPGEDAEGVLDEVSWQIRVVGPQNDYDAAEDVAIRIDRAFLSHFSSNIPGTTHWVTKIQRVGGAPNPLLRDSADRTHFVCSYILSEELALTN